MRRLSIWIIGGLAVLGVCAGLALWVTRPTPQYDLTARHPGEIPPGTVIGSTAPAGWSHLVIKSLPRVHPDHRAALFDYVAKKASWMFTAFVADVVPDVAGGRSRYRLRAVALGLGTSVDGRDMILTPETGDQFGADIGLIGRDILAKGYAVQRQAVMVVHGQTMGLVDTPVWFRCGTENRLVRYRYALLVDAPTGQLDVLVWRFDPEDGSCGGLAEVVRLNPDTIDEAELVVDPRRVNALGIPFEDAFAVEKMPPGRRLPFPADLRPLAAKSGFSPAEALALESRLRQLLAD